VAWSSSAFRPHAIVVAQHHLARQARIRLQAPGHVEQIFFLVGRVIQRVETFADHHVAGGTGAGFFAGVFDIDVAVEHGVAQALAGRRVDDGAVRAKRGVWKYDDLWHGIYL